jgi:tRNA(Ile)-lysidine synthetase-like protein
VDLKGGLRLVPRSEGFIICASNAELPFDLWPQMPVEDSLTLPPGGGCTGGRVEVESCERWRLPALAREQAERNEDQFQVWLDADELPESFELRVRRQGDHFSPLGMGGHSQKMSDFFVNEKLPQRARDRWPLLCAGDEIVWVPGYRPAHRHRLKDGDKQRRLFFDDAPA